MEGKYTFTNFSEDLDNGYKYYLTMSETVM